MTGVREFLLLSTFRCFKLKTRQRPHRGAGSCDVIRWDPGEVLREGVGKGAGGTEGCPCRRGQSHGDAVPQRVPFSSRTCGWLDRSLPPSSPPSETSFLQTHFQTLLQSGLMASVSFSGTFRTRTLCPVELGKTSGSQQREGLANLLKAPCDPDLVGKWGRKLKA